MQKRKKKIENKKKICKKFFLKNERKTDVHRRIIMEDVFKGLEVKMFSFQYKYYVRNDVRVKKNKKKYLRARKEFRYNTKEKYCLATSI